MRLGRICVGAIVLFGSVGCASSADREAIGSSQDSTDSEADTTTTERDTTTTERESTTTTEGEKDLTVESGFSTGVNSIGTRYTSVGALVTNPNESLAAYDVSVVFNLKSASGAILDTDTANVPYVPAASTIPVAPLQIGFDVAEEPASVEVNIAGTFAKDTGWSGVGFSMSDGIDLEVAAPSITPGDYGSTLAFTATNPGDTVAEFASWSCVFNRGGAVVGGETSSVMDPIVPSGTVRVESSLSVESITADEIVCRAYA